MSYQPSDLLPDDQNELEKDGKTIRKGTMGAALANAAIIESPHATDEEKQAALDAIKTLVPSLKAFNLTTFFQWKNPKMQALFDGD